MDDATLELPVVDWAVPFLLLALRERSSYGYELAEEMAGLDFGVARPEVAYRTLQQMKEEGMVLSEQDGAGGPSRRRYSISEWGKVYLEFWASSLARYQEEVDLFIRVYDGSSLREVRG